MPHASCIRCSGLHLAPPGLRILGLLLAALGAALVAPASAAGDYDCTGNPYIQFSDSYDVSLQVGRV